ncbi:hypothetical protein DPMN_016105 [Dreissena polymorpha]|uniref:Voltage-gated hydrogen channel 1 n=2 Tax=Dreissena polymorpha TaxID=45954 RepID=A0A9D4NE50_DREPO|nr:hypothetical protein DPMN_016105 [Dreissena polymorpha]
MSREKYVSLRKNKISSLRDKGARILHSKHVLMMVVVLNLADCCLVLGELILDIHFIKGLRDETEQQSEKFVKTIVNRYPDALTGYPTEELGDIFKLLYAADCSWPPREEAFLPHENEAFIKNDDTDDEDSNNEISQDKNSDDNASDFNTDDSDVKTDSSDDSDDKTGLNATRLRRNADYRANPSANSNIHTMKEPAYKIPQSVPDVQGTDTYAKTHTMIVNVAHGLHKASITILGILFFESILKIICMGKHFLEHKLEVFDVVVVTVSFVVDLVLIKGLMWMKVQDAVFILSLLLPWRVIRVVNSLIVAVLDHEHFRLKMMHKEKKVIAGRLETLEKTAKQWNLHLKQIEAFCESEGIPNWKIRPYTALWRKESTISKMASLALSGILPGIIMGPSDKKMFGTLENCFAQIADSKDCATKSNTNTSNAFIPSASMPIIMHTRHNVPEVNIEIDDESDDSNDGENLIEPVTGSRSNMSRSGSPYLTPVQSMLSDLSHSILMMGTTPPRMTLDLSTDMRPLMSDQTSDQTSTDSDEIYEAIGEIKPRSEVNTIKANPLYGVVKTESMLRDVTIWQLERDMISK